MLSVFYSSELSFKMSLLFFNHTLKQLHCNILWRKQTYSVAAFCFLLFFHPPFKLPYPREISKTCTAGSASYPSSHRGLLIETLSFSSGSILRGRCLSSIELRTWVFGNWLGYIITCLSIAKVANLTISLDRSAGKEAAVIVSVGTS